MRREADAGARGRRKPLRFSLMPGYKSSSVRLAWARQRFDLHSDIDLAVRGISWSEYWRLWSKVDALADIPVDLVMLDGASPSLAERVDLEGVVLYEEGGRQPIATAEG